MAKKQKRLPVERVEADIRTGLTSAQAEERRKKGYANVVTDKNEKSFLKILAGNTFTFFNAILFLIASANTSPPARILPPKRTTTSARSIPYLWYRLLQSSDFTSLCPQNPARVFMLSAVAPFIRLLPYFILKFCLFAARV